METVVIHDVLLSPEGITKRLCFLMFSHGPTAAPCRNTGSYRGTSGLIAKSLPATAGSTFRAHSAALALAEGSVGTVQNRGKWMTKSTVERLTCGDAKLL